MRHVLNACALSIVTFVVPFLCTSVASAACTPAGNAGDVAYSSVQNIMAYCNGTNWIGMGTPQTVSFGTLTGGDFCTATSGSAIACNTPTIPASSITAIAGLSVLGTATTATASPGAITGTANQALIVNSAGTGLAFGALNLASSASVTGILANANGGTGTATYSTGDMLYASAANTLSRLAAGTNGNILTLAGGVPTWAAAPATGVTSFSAGTTGLTPNTATTGAVVLAGTLAIANGGTALSSYNKGDIVYGSAANVLSALPIGTSGYILTAGAGGVPVWSAAPATGVSSFSGGTTGLTPATASTGAIVLSGVLIVPNGGTGLATLTSNVIYKGNGTGALAASGLSDNGTVVSSSESIDATGKSYITEIANAGTTGTTVNKLAKLNTSGAAIISATPDTDGMLGIVVGETAGGTSAVTTGNAQIAVGGQAACVFDGATTAGDYVGVSSSSAGDCHDFGASRPTVGQSVGRVLSTNGSGGTYAVALASNGSVGNTTTMIANWPDAIECIASGGATYIFYYDEGSSGSVTYYRSIQNTASDLYVDYTTSTGAYAGELNVAADCTTNSWSISQLYAMGRAFNFIGSAAGTMGIGNGGTNATSQTTNGVNYFNGTSITSGTGFTFTGTNVGIGSTSPGAALTVAGVEALNFGTDYSTTGSQNNVNIGAVSSVRYTGGGIATFTGIIAGTSNVGGEILTLHNASSSALTLSNQNTNSTILNRIVTGTGADLIMASNSSVVMQYDGSAGLWRVIGGSGGGTAAGSTGQVQFNTANAFNANTNLTWDNTNFRLGIGSASPTVGLDLSQKTDALALPVGTSGQRPTCSAGSNGILRYNSTIPAVEACVNGAWVSVGAGGGQMLGSYSSSCGSGYSLTCGSNYSVLFTGAAGSAPSLSGSTLILASNTAYYTVELWGGGGGGGGGAACGTGSNCGAGSGGGGGGYTTKLATVPTAYYFQLGAAGAGGGAGAAGGNGGNTCFGTNNSSACTSSLLTAGGGGGGGGGVHDPGGAASGGGGGGGAGGDVNLFGSGGVVGVESQGGAFYANSGNGGSASRGGGGGAGAGENSTGGIGNAYGGGGGGGGISAGTGAAGGAGGITVTAYSSGSTQAFNLGTQASGTLPVANGGTGDTSALTQGSVVFAGASGVYSQDNANFFYDATNHRLGIGTATPGALLTVGATSAAADFGGTANQKRAVIAYSSANTVVGSDDGFVIRNENTTTGNTTGLHFSTGSGASSGGAQNVVTASIVAVNAARTANQYSAADLTFLTSPGGNAADAERMRITAAGNVGIGTTIPGYSLDIANNQDGFTAAQITNTNNTANARSGIVLNGSTVSTFMEAVPPSNTSVAGWAGSSVLGSNANMYIGPYNANSLFFETGGVGTTRMTINPSGYVGIGTASPSMLLQLRAGTDSNLRFSTAPNIFGGTTGFGFQSVNDALNAVEPLVISGSPVVFPSGNVGIGTTSPNALLDISANNTATTGMARITSTNANGQMSLDFVSGTTTTRARIRADYVGDLILAASGSGLVYLGYPDLGSGNNVQVNGTSTTCVIGNGTGATNCTSDIRLKKDIALIPDALAKLAQLRGVTFHWKDPAKSGAEHIGVIAQDVEKVFPQAVGTLQDKTIGTAKTVDIAALVAPIIEALKELKSMFDADHDALTKLKADNDNLRAANDNEAAQIKALTARLDALEASHH